jgi:outer membrane receptor protein involved in Fe transport
MQRLLFVLFAFLAISPTILKAQYPGGGPPSGGFDPSKMNVGRFYGKVVDERGKGLGYATVKLYGKKFDPRTKTLKDTLLAGQLTADNGDFNLEKVPAAGDFNLVIDFMGYAQASQTVTFGIKRPSMPPGGGPGGKMPTDTTKAKTAGGPKPAGGGMPTGGGMPAGGPPGGGFGMGNIEKDLGNIALKPDAKTLAEVTVTEKASLASLSLDRKSYRVDKDISVTGGTAQDALKNIPSLSVDLDGNVSLRNGAPQIFVDGRPTTLSLDQIAADAIETVEVITNPSSKYDAGGGTAGIINIVLKKEKRLGYNGNVRVGGDSRGGYNFGGDLNARGEKVNLFGAVNVNRMKGMSEGETFRQNLVGNPLSNITQTSDGLMRGLFANARAGADFLLDNRNTLTLSGNFTRGKFTPGDDITTTTDFLYPAGTVQETYMRSSAQDRNFRNLGSSVQFKHLFPKKGAEWTADANYNQVRFEGGSDFSTQYTSGKKSQEQQSGLGNGRFVTIQSDFVNPLNDKTKWEGGIRAAMRVNKNDNMNSFFDYATNEWIPVTSLSDHYKFNDNVFAAYSQLSRQAGNWGFQAGLRAESSIYKGALTDRDSSFTIAYPISLFPSFFVTHKFNETTNLQFAYTRRVNRPNFFQTMPFTDFSDSLNLRRGNPSLVPEFTNSLELSYQKIFSKGHNLLVSLYYKQATNLITTYQFTEFNTDLNKQVVITSYTNSDYAAAYGAEITLKNTFFSILDLTTNLNAYQSDVNAGNVEQNLSINRITAFFKENVQLRLPQKWTVQLNGEYRTRASFTPSNNNDPFRGGPGGGTQNSAQGYSIANWFMDVSVKKDFLKNKASLSLSVQDIFATRRQGSYTATDFIIQESSRIMNPQTVRLNFSYRFGKMDSSLFARKNNRTNMQGNDMM